MAKILDLTSRLKSRNSAFVSEKNSKHKSKREELRLSRKEFRPSAPILDMTEARQAALNRDRRNVKRTILTEFIGAFVVLPERGLYRVSLYDISENGLSFDIDLPLGHYKKDEEVAMRVYLNHKTYFTFIVKVTNARVFEEENIMRHGANFVKGTINHSALHHFVKFIETVSANLRTDSGDILVSQIS
jgi:hypothetical protein